MLFMSVDGAADLASQGHSHSDTVVHQVGDLYIPADTQTSKSDEDHCERCCHGHTAGITTPITSVNAATTNNDHRLAHSANVDNFAQAPPTPPA